MKIVIERKSVEDYLSNPISLEQYKALLRDVRKRYFIRHIALLISIAVVVYLSKNTNLSKDSIIAITAAPAFLLEALMFVRKPLAVNIRNLTFKMPPWLIILQNEKSPSELEGNSNSNEVKLEFLDKIKQQGRNVLKFELDILHLLDKN